MFICTYIHNILLKVVENKMLEITKDEAKYLREHGITEGITRTMRQKSKRGKKQLCCEDRHIVALLKDYRDSLVIRETYGEV